ncbi:hypothetical protein PsAD13_01665 [Pseudovibrio sp. Ad13]|uniref:DUF2147 domain-containing protein n=1 Tax=unclassified Pseudovibrio TaxID=2627060 RepID=UPI0007AE57BD|nr:MULTISPECIES: DUF2147 domain-containing protein [unclassified Pseudovibrio]KZK85130.1 hypothetical protein PsAD13_01665 [Pseudovibrio sp. Ad13]KZK94164.1 hypothetical protein PsW74_04824 [Pseudovibrio sp. W74]KZL09981.1 hypothetical protein PsAD14_01505 [Pseudovibrio sp. Ad14]
MKTLMLSSVIALTMSSSIALAADPAIGVWETGLDEGRYSHVKIEQCGDKMCGTLLRLFEEDGTPVNDGNIGKTILWDMTPKPGGKYRDGKFWRVFDGKTYNGKMDMLGSQLKVSGCVMFICAGQKWNRTE